MKVKLLLITLLFIFLASLILGSTVKGRKGDPILYQNDYDTSVGGPFESTNSSSRYATIKSYVDTKSFLFNRDLARFSAPDVVNYKDTFFSIFTPGVAFLGIPFYMLGKLIGLPQLITYLSVSIFAVINAFLVARLSVKLGASFYTGILSGFLFLFATNAFSYALTLTQHHMSVTMLLLGFLLVIGRPTFLKNVVYGALVGMGLLIDIPNPILMLPLSLYLVFKHIHIRDISEKIKISFSTALIGLLIGILPLFSLFAWYNFQTTGSYTKIGQSIGQSKIFDSEEQKAVREKKAEIDEVNSSVNPVKPKATLPFNTRKQLSGFYTLLMSDERAWIFYSPVVFIGFLGLFLVYRIKERQDIAVIALSVIFLNILIYGSFGDPWGGWSFGPRYLIPAAAILCAGIGVTIQRFKNNILYFLTFLILSVYSIGVNTLGALTTNAIPPKIEAINLSVPLPHTYEYNLRLINIDQTSSLFYNLFLNGRISAQAYWIVLTLIIMIVISLLYAYTILDKRKELV